MYTNTMLFSESQIIISTHMIDGWSNGLVLKSKNESLQILMDPIIIKQLNNLGSDIFGNPIFKRAYKISNPTQL